MLLFIDADIVFEVQAADAVVALAAQIPGVVGAIYSSKRPGGAAIVQQVPGTNHLPCFTGGDVRDVLAVGMGLTAIHSYVLKRTPARNLIVKSMGGPSRRVRMWFATTDPDWDEVESDDYAFCRRARAAGCKIVVDARQRIEHIGPYRYRLEDIARPLVTAETLLLPAPKIDP